MSALDLVYQYRKLLGKCESGLGLDVDDIIALTALEAVFAGDDRDGRQHRRERVEMACLLRGPGHGDGINDRVRISELGPGGLVCRQAPFADDGTVLEVVIDDPEMSLSYRFKARVAWLREDVGDDFALGLTFVGAPLLIHHGPVDHVEDAVDRIAIAA
ncbi:MAG: hypothetical protein H6709_22485 [Kofleriaceae bacterium]|nr:hypothetical protein [Myxococcales bacterium]MCB9574850.1 hypothetical protein [Kofleriaceae bacterium]